MRMFYSPTPASLRVQIVNQQSLWYLLCSYFLVCLFDEFILPWNSYQLVMLSYSFGLMEFPFPRCL